MTVLAKKTETSRPVPSLNPRLTRFLLSIVLREVVKRNRLELIVLNQVLKPFSRRRLRTSKKSRQSNLLHAEREIVSASQRK